MTMAIIIVDIAPSILFETLVYHSEKKRYIEVIKSKMGKQNKMATGRPAINLADILLNLSLSFSQ